MRRLLVHWASNFVAVLVVAAILDPHIRLPPVESGDYWTTAAAFAGVLAVLNTYVRPIVYVVFAPITCLVMVVTLGLAHFVMGALMFWLAGKFVNAFYVENFGYALFGAAITAAVGLAGSMLLEDRRPVKI